MTKADEHRTDLVRATVPKGKGPVVWYETIFGGSKIRHVAQDGELVDLAPEAATAHLSSGALVRVP